MSKDWGRNESEFKLIECISALLGEIPGEAFARKPSEWDSDGRISVNKSSVKVCKTEEGLEKLGFTSGKANAVGCIYAHYKVNPNIFQFYFDFMNIFLHPPMHPLFRNAYEFYLIFYYFTSSFIVYNYHFCLRRTFLF